MIDRGRKAAAGAVLAVADTGPGIPAEDRAARARALRAAGSEPQFARHGPRLSLVAAVARLHDARLELDDNHPGLKASIVFAGANQAADSH